MVTEDTACLYHCHFRGKVRVAAAVLVADVEQDIRVEPEVTVEPLPRIPLRDDRRAVLALPLAVDALVVTIVEPAQSLIGKLDQRLGGEVLVTVVVLIDPQRELSERVDDESVPGRH